jgi:hypothetical protein
MYARILLLLLIWCGAVAPANAQSTLNLGACDEFAYSTEGTLSDAYNPV